MRSPMKGVFSPVVTPFNRNLVPDLPRLVHHCRWLQGNHISLVIFGTNSEANSLSIAERSELLGALVDAGINPKSLLVGTGTCALTDTVLLTKQAIQCGCGGVLMLPPFYYKQVSDEGLYRYFSEVVQRVGNAGLRIYLYHIPSVSQVPIGLRLIARLLRTYPKTFAGIKDSSGDWSNTETLLKEFQPHGFDVFAGSDSFLLDTLRLGGAGCISATANVNPAAIHRLYAAWHSDDADRQQLQLQEVRHAFHGHAMIPALKRAIAHWSGIEEWAIVRPPLVALDDTQASRLVANLEALGFDMPSLREA